MYIQRLGLTFLVAFFCFNTNLESVADDPQLDVLNAYEGTWTSRFSIQPQGNNTESHHFTGKISARWVVGRNFLDQTGTYRKQGDSSEITIKTLMSFDDKKERYQYDYFISNGDVQRSYGQWDPAAKTMTSKMVKEKDGSTTTIIANFSKPDTEEWSIEISSQDGTVTTRIEGTNRRIK